MTKETKELDPAKKPDEIEPGKEKPEEKKPEVKPEQKPETADEKVKREQAEAEAKKIAEAAGLDSEIGAKKKELEKLRLEKRDLTGAPQIKKPVVKTDDEDEDDKPDPEAEASEIDKKIKEQTEPLRQALTVQQKQIEKEAIANVSNNSKFPLINPTRDVENKNWTRLLPNYIPPKELTREKIEAAVATAYYATFGPEIEAEAEERGRAKGAAEALTAKQGDIGTGNGEVHNPPVELTDAQKTAAKKMGLTEDQYIEGMRKSGRTS